MATPAHSRSAAVQFQADKKRATELADKFAAEKPGREFRRDFRIITTALRMFAEKDDVKGVKP